jgi:hypothetical protein
MDKFELLEELRGLDEITLLELLEITSEDLVDRFIDRIEDNLPKLYDKATPHN